MSGDELRERLLASRIEPIEAGLFRQLEDLPQVRSVTAMWFHGWVRIVVVLNEWTWAARERPNELIDAFAREHVHQFSVTHRFEPPELTP